MFRNLSFIIILLTLVGCSNSADFDPGPCPRAAILKGYESKDVRNSNLKIELNRTIMICEYNLRRKTINFDLGIFGDVINSGNSFIDNSNFSIFITFVGPGDTVINKWSKRVSVDLEDQTISSFSIPAEGLRSRIEEGRTGSSYKVLVGLE